jgi:hypothetical protein
MVSSFLGMGDWQRGFSLLPLEKTQDLDVYCSPLALFLAFNLNFGPRRSCGYHLDPFYFEFERSWLVVAEHQADRIDLGGIHWAAP